jgi:multidrug efflux system outer membrane protein
MYEAPDVPHMDTPDEFKNQIDADNSQLKNAWWENFNDEDLNELVAEALDENYNYQIALNNIDIAVTYVDQNRSAFFPQIDAAATYSRNKFVPDEFFGAFPTPGNGSPVTTTSSSPSSGSAASPFLNGGIFDVNLIALSASYELDVWNQVGNSVKQAQANVIANQAQADVIKLSLVSAVVNTYFQLMALNTNLNNLNQQYVAIDEIKELAHVQYVSGLIDESQVYNAKIQKQNTGVMIEATEKQKQIMENTLAYLLGEYPEEFDLEPEGSLNQIAFDLLIPEGVPSQMLTERPDIQSAYYQMLSYGYLEKQALSNFFPSFSLTGGYGYANQDLGSLISEPSKFWSYGVNVSQFVFDYAVRESEYDRAGEQFESSILNYQDTVMNAFTEVNNALVSYQEDNEALHRYLQQSEHYQQLVSIADAQYQAGLVNYTTYLNNELSLLQTQYNVTNQQLMVAQDVIAVYKSLGLGLEEPYL